MARPSKSATTAGIRVVCRFREVPKGHQRFDYEILQGKTVSFNARYKTMFQDSGNSKESQTDLIHLDAIFDRMTSQEHMFEFVGYPIVLDVLSGYNGTILTYGQTGSGKTFSLFGDITNPDSANRGLIPRSCQTIFENVANNETVEEAVIKCSFVEIYNEHLHDLLNPSNVLKIREDKRNGIFIQGCCEDYVTSFDDVYSRIILGLRNRAVASTLMNQESSRSHCVLILSIKQTLKTGEVQTSKVNFADLAGSEKVEKTGATGDVFEEAKFINYSLTQLGVVINALTENKKDKNFIPYRSSKLTYLLSNSLGGNAKTSLLITCSEDELNMTETISSLKFAQRAKKITNNVTINKELSKKELKIQLKTLQIKANKHETFIAAFLDSIQFLNTDAYKKNPSQFESNVNNVFKVISEHDAYDNTTTPASQTQPTGVIMTEASQATTKNVESIISKWKLAVSQSTKQHKLDDDGSDEMETMQDLKRIVANKNEEIAKLKQEAIDMKMELRSIDFEKQLPLNTNVGNTADTNLTVSESITNTTSIDDDNDNDTGPILKHFSDIRKGFHELSQECGYNDKMAIENMNDQPTKEEKLKWKNELKSEYQRQLLKEYQLLLKKYELISQENKQLHMAQTELRESQGRLMQWNTELQGKLRYSQVIMQDKMDSQLSQISNIRNSGGDDKHNNPLDQFDSMDEMFQAVQIRESMAMPGAVDLTAPRFSTIPQKNLENNDKSSGVDSAKPTTIKNKFVKYVTRVNTALKATSCANDAC